MVRQCILFNEPCIFSDPHYIIYIQLVECILFFQCKSFKKKSMSQDTEPQHTHELGNICNICRDLRSVSREWRLEDSCVIYKLKRRKTKGIIKL